MDRLTQCLVTVAKRNVLARVAPAEVLTPGRTAELLDHAATMTPQSAWLYRAFCCEMERLWLTTPETRTMAPGCVGGSQHTRLGEIARLPRVAEGLCLFSANDQQPVAVAQGWGSPIVDWMERVAILCSDQNLDGAALLEKIEAEVDALVDVAALMDISALADTLEAGMGGAALAGAELALKKAAGKKGFTTFAAGDDEPVIVQRGRPVAGERIPARDEEPAVVQRGRRVAGERIPPRDDGTTLVQQGRTTPGERIPQREDGVIATYAPLGEAVAKLNRKTPIGSKLTSAEWARMPLALRERAQFSARVESVRFLGTVQDQMRKRLSLEKERLANGKSAFVDRGSFIQTMRRIAEEENLNTTSNASQRGSVRDIRSAKRLGLIYDMQTNQAQEYARWKMDHDADVLDAFPAQRFLRVMDVAKPREDGFWASRWNEAGAKVNWAGAKQRPMVALKTSPIWAALSIFGTPWPPFDWGSGMGLEDVDREEAETMGLLKRAAPVPELGGGEPSFNNGLEASVADLPARMVTWLIDGFGDQVEIADGRARWIGVAA